MKRQTLISTITLFIILISNSCTKVGPEGPAGQSGTSLTGTLIGFITLYDEFGVPVADKSGVKVTIDGYTPALSATTNSAGRYQIDNLQNGTWDLTISKTGYVTNRYLGFSFVGGISPRIYSTYLSQPASTLVTNLQLSVYSSSQMTISGTLSPVTPSGYSRYFRLFFSKTSPVSATNYLTAVSYGTTAASFSILRSFDKVSFPSGTTLYMIATGETYYSYSIQDLTSGLYNYLTASSATSNIASIVVP